MPYTLATKEEQDGFTALAEENVMQYSAYTRPMFRDEFIAVKAVAEYIANVEGKTFFPMADTNIEKSVN